MLGKQSNVQTIEHVNGYKHPKQYDLADLEYFIEDIKQITMESKRQEAGTVHD